MTTRRRGLGLSGWLLLGLALMASCAQTLATSGRVSVTAESVCALRAAAAQHPDPKVRNPDYLAERSVDEAFWRASPYRNEPERARRNPTYFYVNARTHHMDALLVEALSQGATQVVSLEAANLSTLRFIRSASASGSSVVYDYVLDTALRPDGGGVYGRRAPRRTWHRSASRS